MRDFFERQDVSRRLTGRLAVILAGAVLSTVLATAVVLAGVATILGLIQFSMTTRMEVDTSYWIDAFTTRLYLATFVTGVIVIGVVVHKTWRALDSGGAELARQMGGMRVMAVNHDPKYRQLIDVVEELAIAAGVPAPKIFVLEHEKGINAFAAGTEPKDTVVGVTQGALDHLDRSQLQGVLAHEFSHIVNRDVRINVQALGALQGIEAIASAAKYLLRMGVTYGVNGSPVATAFGYALWPVGQIGVLFGSLAKMGLNRQREYLADAAAVQFTRYPEGLSSALKLIAAHARDGALESDVAQNASHLFFAEGISPQGGLLSSHPPIEERIRRLDPEWDGELPLALPAGVAKLIEPENSVNADDHAEAYAMGTPAAVAHNCEAVIPATRTRPHVAPSVLPEARGDAAGFDDAGFDDAGDSGISEADKQAFLESLASVRASNSLGNYNPQETHWPTLAVTAVAVLCAAAAFTWFTSR